ncbi:MAG: carbon starvation protein A [Bacteroidales bacterium]|nr:carbon starvation protein A [Bacteroidales bacterium]
MVTFLIAIVLLVLGYLVYSKIIERILVVDPKRATPAVAHPDGVDYVPMKPWRIYLIQFLNIAGVGPICGAIMGAQFGSASFLWIVFGSIFAGAVHDFIAGYISIRHDGASLPEIHGKYLGKKTKTFMAFFTILLMVLVGAVFVKTPSQLLLDNFTPGWSIWIWPVVIFVYYLVATLLPIDKVIGRIYPIFGFLLLAMAVLLVVAFFINPDVQLIELWDGLENRHPQKETNPIFPMMFISIACGAISGFHATQSPLMARCMTNERQARPVFYGAMITEGVVALIWAAAAAYFFHDKPELCAGRSGDAMVGVICNEWFPKAIAVICVLGVISAAITSGDTALRSARLIVADQFHINQKPMAKRIAVALPLFALAGGLLVYAFSDVDGFQTIWRYFAWCNQLLAVVTLWTITVYLFLKRKPYILTLLPAMFMTMVTGCFLFVAEKEGLGAVIPHWLGYTIGAAITLAVTALFVWWAHRHNSSEIEK